MRSEAVDAAGEDCRLEQSTVDEIRSMLGDDCQLMKLRDGVNKLDLTGSGSEWMPG